VLSPPPSAAPSQTTRCAAAALCPLVRGPFHFHPALRSSPITLRYWEDTAPEALAVAPRPPPVAASAAASSSPPPPSGERPRGPRGGGGSGSGGGGSAMEPGPGGRGAARGQRPPNAAQPREQERKLEQEKLSGVVKSVHRRLRKKYREGKQASGEGRRVPRLGQLFSAPQATIDTHGGGTSAQAAIGRPASCGRLPEP
jgi:hypothetical protein